MVRGGVFSSPFDECDMRIKDSPFIEYGVEDLDFGRRQVAFFETKMLSAVSNHELLPICLMEMKSVEPASKFSFLSTILQAAVENG